MSFASVNKVTHARNRSKVSRVRKIRVLATAYCPCKICCGRHAKGITKLGDNAWIIDGVAADFRLFKPRTKLRIPGFGLREVDDTGGAMRKSGRRGIYHVDIRMRSHAKALDFGSNLIEIQVLNEPKRS